MAQRIVLAKSNPSFRAAMDTNFQTSLRPITEGLATEIIRSVRTEQGFHKLHFRELQNRLSHKICKMHRSTNPEGTMTTLTVTARGQVTFRKEILKHIGIEPGEKIELDSLPNGRAVLKAARKTGTIVGFVGLLAGQTENIATIEEINAATARGWTGEE